MPQRCWQRRLAQRQLQAAYQTHDGLLLAHVAFIIDPETVVRPLGACVLVPKDTDALARSCLEAARQPYRKLAAFANLTVDRDCATMLLRDNGVRD
jgi:hypothetical protein